MKNCLVLFALLAFILCGCAPGAESEFTPSKAEAKVVEKAEPPQKENHHKTVIRIIPKDALNGKPRKP